LLWPPLLTPLFFASTFSDIRVILLRHCSSESAGSNARTSLANCTL
jgi:hypothetical protein